MRFVEHNVDGSVKWEAYGNFSPLDVHRQVSQAGSDFLCFHGYKPLLPLNLREGMITECV